MLDKLQKDLEGGDLGRLRTLSPLSKSQNRTLRANSVYYHPVQVGGSTRLERYISKRNEDGLYQILGHTPAGY